MGMTDLAATLAYMMLEDGGPDLSIKSQLPANIMDRFISHPL
jgi:hypothetical protein